MGYKRAEDVLPQDIIELIQKYVDGECIYIPRLDGMRKEWGSTTSTKSELALRDEQIFSEYLSGFTVLQLAEKYFLSDKSIQRIIRKFKQCEIH